MPVVQCPNCDKKMKLREPKPGKRLRCPGCQEPFMPFPAKPSGQPTKKKARPAPVDEFEEEDFDAPAPRRKPKAGAPKNRGAKGKKKAAAKGGKGGKSKMPLLIGVGVLGVALAGGLTWMLMGGNDDSDDTATAATNGEDNNAETGEGADGDGHEASGGHDGANGEETGGSAEPTATNSTNVAAGSGESSPTGAVPGNINLRWLPRQAEAMVHIDFDRLLSGPIGQLLQNPLVSGQVDAFRAQAGFGPEDLGSLTVGVGGIGALVTSGQPPTPESLPVIGVLRLKKPVDATKLQAAIPGASTTTEGSLNFIRLPGDLPKSMWFADSSTVIIGAEDAVRQAATTSPSPTALDTALLDGQSVVQVLFSPRDTSIFQHPGFQAPPEGPPGATAIVTAIRQNVTAVAFNFDLTNDIGVSLATRCRDASGAQQVAAAFTEAQSENTAQAEAMANSPQAAMLGPMIDISRQMSESTRIEAVDTICRSTAIATDGGQQVVNYLPVMIGSAMAQGFSQGAAIQSTTTKNNLRQIGIAMHNFHDAYGRFPNTAPQSPTGEKWLSWRVHLLPFLGEEDLYKQFNLEEPWDSPTNRPLAELMPEVFRSPEDNSLLPGQTLFQTPVSAGTAFEGEKGFPLRAFTDGTSNTVLVLEAAPTRAVYWTQPIDFDFNPDQPLNGIGGFGPDGFHAVFADGSVRFIDSSTATETLKAIFTRNGGEVVNGI